VKVYISGKISGESPNHVRDKFDKAEQYINGMGFTAISPLKNGLPEQAPWIEHMKRDISFLFEADAIYMLEDYKKSNGALIELEIAKGRQILIMFQKI
jgi:hypothetical protein